MYAQPKALTSTKVHLMAATSPTTPDTAVPSTVHAIAAPHGHTALLSLVQHAHAFLADSTAPATRTAYARDGQAFATWCAQQGLVALPAHPEVLVCYVTALALDGRKVNTITRHLAAIAFMHQEAGHASPTRDATVRAVMSGIRRTIGVAPHQVDALDIREIRLMIAVLPETLLGLRDQALILLGFAGAFRRSELIALEVADLRFSEDGISVWLRRSKTDQEGVGRWVGIPYGQQNETCPVRAVQAWITAAGIEAGALSRGINRHGRLASSRLSKRAIGDIIKRTVQAAGLDPARYSGHSLRAGHCTTAARAGASERLLMKQMGHRSSAMVQRYIRAGSLFQENSATYLGL